MTDADLQNKGVAAQGARTKVSDRFPARGLVLMIVLEGILQCQRKGRDVPSAWTRRVCARCYWFQGGQVVRRGVTKRFLIESDVCDMSVISFFYVNLHFAMCTSMNDMTISWYEVDSACLYDRSYESPRLRL